jgi:hypothetical protein
MKKYLVVLLVAAFALSANYALAKNDNGINLKGRNHAKLDILRGNEGRMSIEGDTNPIKRYAAVVKGTVKSKNSDSITLTIDNRVHPRWEILGKEKKLLEDERISGELVVKLNSDTKFHKDKNEIGADQVAVGDNIMVIGKRDGATFVANHVFVMQPKSRSFGEVTAKTDNTVTIKNNATGESKTVELNPETQISINGEAKTAADIQVGDKGFVKYRVAADLVAKVVKLFR